MITRELKNLVKKKTKVLNTYLSVKSFCNLIFYMRIRNSVTNAVKIASINFENKLVDDMLDNPYAFWKYVSLTQKSK